MEGGIYFHVDEHLVDTSHSMKPQHGNNMKNVKRKSEILFIDYHLNLTVLC